MSAKVVVVGSLNMDLVARAQRLPRAGETLPGESFFTVPGGKAPTRLWPWRGWAAAWP